MFEFEYSPYPESGSVFFFAQAIYKSGFIMGSNLINRKFTSKEVRLGYKNNIVYTSRFLGAESVFTAENQKESDSNHVNVSEKKRVLVKKGPYGIEGICCEWGMLTFKVNAQKDKPNDGAIMIFDVYAKNDLSFNVKLIVDYFGARTEYLANVKVEGGEVWHNIKLTINKFKTVEGRSLKIYEKVNAIAFSSSEENYLINNVLWV